VIGASLPVIGFIIWYNRKFGKKFDELNIDPTYLPKHR